MTQRELLALAEQVLTIPTAPYHEHGVRAFVVEYCRRLGLRVKLDRVGNVIAQQSGRGRPIVFVAHMDHPGFEALGGKRVEFLGGVPQEMFPKARIRFGKSVARVTRVTGRKLMEVDVTLRRGEFGMWDLPMFQVRDGMLRATAIDDVLSVAVVLATLKETRRLRKPVWGVFTRAEETGFNGATALARARIIPREALVISMEMSKERPWARQGDGPVVRVGDRATMFDAAASYFLCEAARRYGVKFQRALMDGGTCEATAFGAFGYRVGGMCLPLGNYHNIGKNMKPQAEYVRVDDLCGLLKLTVAVAREWRGFAGVMDSLQKKVREIEREAPRKLSK